MSQPIVAAIVFGFIGFLFLYVIYLAIKESNKISTKKKKKRKIEDILKDEAGDFNN